MQEEIPEGTLAKTVDRLRQASTPFRARTSPRAQVTDLDDLAGLVADAEILPGEQLLEARFIDPAELAARGDVPVPAGMQLVSFTLPADRVVGGEIVAGDRIGMVGTVDPDEIGDAEDVVNPISQFAFNGVLVTEVQGVVAAGSRVRRRPMDQDAGDGHHADDRAVDHDIERWVWFAEGEAHDYANMWLTLQNDATDTSGLVAGRPEQRLPVTPFLLVSRSAEYESRLRALLGARLRVVTGEFLTFGAESVVDRVDGTPRIALLGPVLNYEETQGPGRGLTARHPDIGLIVVREQRSDLEDWVDELALHAVLSPNATDETTRRAHRPAVGLARRERGEGRSPHDFDAPAGAR